MDSVVPPTPPGLCFPSEKFIGAEFSADSFLQDLWNEVPLEVLRDDLGAYLKVLRSAMIELINRDYADFVNLSGNLVGLDSAISKLQEPFYVIQAEIKAVEDVLNDAHQKLLLTLRERQQLREKKLVVESIMKIPQHLEHLEKILSNVSSENMPKMLEEDPTFGNVIERAANEFIQYQHLLVRCNKTSIAADLKHRTEKVNSSLMKCMEDAFFYGIDHQKKDVLQKTLRTYVVLDKCSHAEELVRNRLINPTFKTILNQTALKMEPRDLSGLLLKLKDFIRQKLKELVDISISFAGANGFNLVQNCLWPEFFSCLTDNLDCIFAQGDPDLLHKRYSCTIEFLEYLDCLSNCSTSQKLTNDPRYQLLMTRWNLPVYFQIRFQEIAGNVETTLMNPLKSESEDRNTFKLKSSETLLNMLHSCYAPDIFLPQLANRFWKLNLQLIARHQLKLKEILSEQKRPEIASSAPLSNSSSSAKLSDLDTLNGGPSLQQLIHLDADIRAILVELPNVWNAASKRLEQLGVTDLTVFKAAFRSSVEGYESLLPLISKLIVNELSAQCSIHLRSVGDIPRLYRRTNREVPTKCFSYVNQMLSVISEFRTLYADRNENIDQWIRGVFQTISKQFHTAVSDVLTSVQKTEESLKRLRKDRVTSASTGVSDDDKIRMQLVIDVDAYVEAVRTILEDSVPEIQSLLDVVEPARSVTRRNSPLRDN